MVAHQWTDDVQCLYLSGQLPGYFVAKDNSRTISLTRYWSQLDKGWFESWPEETKLGLVRGPNDDPLTEEQVKLLGEEMAKTKERLRSWMRYHEGWQRRAAGSAGPAPSNNCRGGKRSLFKLLDKQDAKRPYRKVDIYQKMFGSKIKEEVMANGYGALNEEAEAEHEHPIDVTVLTEEDTKLAEMMADNLAVVRMRRHRVARMSQWHTTSIEMYTGESDEVKQVVEAKTTQLNVEHTKRGADVGDDDKERTLDEYQHGIDQLGAVFAKVHEATVLEAGWYGVTILGGPMPRRGGAISTKTICFGTTALGSDFQVFNPNFEDVESQLNRFLKCTFTHEAEESLGQKRMMTRSTA
ncbi:hypothetical protein B0H10DRAFT_1941935 [Mycena sp. CBHHK59/15]|nr:hypothetical protein B0H10DRAFT_1941935 [Mycena sp. CBHHK59/15]